MRAYHSVRELEEMEASKLARSGSFFSRSCSLRSLRSTSVGRLASPRPTGVHVKARDSAPLRRARSEADLIRSVPAQASWLPLPLKEEKEDGMNDLNRRAFTVQGMIAEEELGEQMENKRETFGGGMGKGGRFSGPGTGGQGGGDQSDNKRIHDRYKEMLKSDPGNPLVLMNYGKFLYEVLVDRLMLIFSDSELERY